MTAQSAPERPDILPPAAWHFPQPSTRELPNGLRVWRFDLPGQHVVSALLVLDVPLGTEPRELEGIATITARTSDEGTTAHPGEQLLDLLEGCGAAYDASAGASATVVGLDVPSTRLATALPLLAEVVRDAAHAGADVERHVALRLAELEQTRISAPSLASLAVRTVLFDPDERVARPLGGRTRTVEAITPEQVQDFRRRTWGPQGATLVLAGELDDSVDAQVDTLFGDWEPTGPRPVHHVPVPAPAPAGARVVHLVDLPGAVQTEVRIAGIGVDRTSRDFAPLQVACTALGGSFGSRLNTVLREERGYTYGAHLGIQPARHGGTWSMQASVRTEVTAAALDDALRILAIDEPLTDDEVRDAVNQQLGIAPLRYDTAGAIASQAATLAAAGWGPDFVDLHFARVADVTATTATEAARRVLALDRARIVLVGDAAVLGDQLASAGYAVEPLVLDL